MNSDTSLGIEEILDFVGEEVLRHLGRRLSKAEVAVIQGTWDGKDYKTIASTSGYNVYYLQSAVGPQLWIMLSEIIGGGVKVTKASLKANLLKLVKKDYVKQLEISEIKEKYLVGKIKLYGDLPTIKSFYGRNDELDYIRNNAKLFNERCIFIVGIGGIGKSLLASKFVEEILLENSDRYQYVIWQRVNHCSSVNQIITELFDVLELDVKNRSLEAKISLLSKYCHTSNYLIVLDGLEGLAQSKKFEEKVKMGNFLFQFRKAKHKSCIILTSQIPLEQVAYTSTTFVSGYIRLQGLAEDAAMRILRENGLDGEECKKLIKNYRGNPSALEAVCDRINQFFGGSVKRFFDYQTTLISERLQIMLDQHFKQNGLLDDLQKEIMIYLAEETVEDLKPISFYQIVDDLKKRLYLNLSISEIITALDALEQSSLVETNRKTTTQEISYSLEPVIKKYITIDPLGLVHRNLNNSKISSNKQE
ncbi:NB-ARC domain-containing protein (plasmid) [Nostoc sp. UHCC 0302]|uniref:NB-ARC domain-containing protein n=1 Tax=Nostoc sp. UHCC 0302 TaxID=3134896 RepID=UPI00311CC0C1